MKYRDHRGSLADSLMTQKEFNTPEELFDHLNKFYGLFGEIVEEIGFIHVCYDSRTGWDTYNLMARLKGEETFFICGMTDGKFEDYEDRDTD